MVPMKHSRVLLFAGLACVLPVLAADEKNEKGKHEAAPAVHVVLKRSNPTSGETLAEVSTTSAVIEHQVDGKLAINVGTTEQPKFWTVDFEADGEGWISLSVNDTSTIQQGVRKGSSWMSPVELFRLNAPFDGAGVVSIYRTNAEALTLEITPAAESAEEKPEAE